MTINQEEKEKELYQLLLQLKNLFADVARGSFNTLPDFAPGSREHEIHSNGISQYKEISMKITQVDFRVKHSEITRWIGVIEKLRFRAELHASHYDYLVKMYKRIDMTEERRGSVQIYQNAIILAKDYQSTLDGLIRKLEDFIVKYDVRPEYVRGGTIGSRGMEPVFVKETGTYEEHPVKENKEEN
jgi:hypothetical protein